MSGQKMIIDVDTGVDDAQAIMMALSQPDVKVIAITCVVGNTTIDNACRNTLRVLELLDRMDVPVYRGSSKSLMGNDGYASDYHGKDGFGDALSDSGPDLQLMQSEPAAVALLRLVNEYPGEITLVALAPLTNIALALRLDPEFGTKLKKCVTMGGNTGGIGKTGVFVEFNFLFDPEAAQIVFRDIRCPLYVVPWETCSKHLLSWDWCIRWFSRQSKISNYLQKISKQIRIRQEFFNKLTGYRNCDPIAMVIAIDPSAILKSDTLFFAIECKGDYFYGNMVCDWRGSWGKAPNATLVLCVDMDRYKQLLHAIVN